MTSRDKDNQPEPRAAAQPTRRSVLVGGGLLAAAAALGIDLTAAACSSSSGTGADGVAGGSPGTTAAPTFRAFSDHQAAVVVEATARLVPGPSDDPAEADHPGAREAGVVHYIDAVLGALHTTPAKVYAGGPFSNRAGHAGDDFAHFVKLSPAVADHWKHRIAAFRKSYDEGVRALDAAAGGDFTATSGADQDSILAKNPDGFTDLLFQHTIEAMYAAPEYGGNKDLVGWHDIGFRGDVQPRGFTDDQVRRGGGPDPYTPTGVPAKVLTILTATAPGSPNQPEIVGNH